MKIKILIDSRIKNIEKYVNTFEEVHPDYTITDVKIQTTDTEHDLYLTAVIYYIEKEGKDG